MRISLPSRADGFALVLLVVVAGVLLALALPAGARAAEACPNEQLRQESRVNGSTGVRYSAELPDCRAFELVTPPEKEQANVGSALAAGFLVFSQASSTGDAEAYVALNPLPGSNSGPLTDQYVAYRGAASWGTVPIDAAQLLSIEVEGSAVDDFLAYSSTLSCGIDQSQEQLAPLPAGEQVGEVKNLYVWSAVTGEHTLVTNTDPINRLALKSATGNSEPYFFPDGVSANCGQVVFATEYQLLAGASLSKPVLYAWDEGVLKFASVLPDGSIVPLTLYNQVTTGSVVGALGGEGAQIAFSAISDTTSGSPGEIDSGHEEVFVREDGTRTVEASKSQTSTPDAGAKYQMGFEGPEGYHVLFTANAGITASSSPTGTDLYDYNVTTKTLTDLTPDANAGDTKGAGVFGVFGAGEGTEGAYVYFSASGQLVPGKGNTQAANESATKEANIYVEHAGQIEYIASIPQGEAESGNRSGQKQDIMNVRTFYTNHRSNVTSSGESLLFGDEGNALAASADEGYNNDSPSGEPQDELYLYSARSKSTVCVSCDPSGARPVNTPVNSAQDPIPVEIGINNGTSKRLLSESGERVLFTDVSALTTRAAAVGAERNAYEWEREGAGESCPVQEHPSKSGGCVFLLAAGGSLLDASASGDDVFIITATPLVAQDFDGRPDVYDASVGGGFPAPSRSECSGEECQGSLNQSLSFAPAGSIGPAAGNVTTTEPEKQGSAAIATPKAPTRAQKLAAALRVCRKQPKRKRATCRARARAKYGVHKSKAKKKVSGKHLSRKGGK